MSVSSGRGVSQGLRMGSEEKCRPCPAEQRMPTLAGSMAMGVQSAGGSRGQHRPAHCRRTPASLLSDSTFYLLAGAERRPPLSPWFPEQENISSPSTEPPERPWESRPWAVLAPCCGREACAGAGRWALNTHASVETASVGTPRARPAPPAQAVKAASRAGLQQARTRVL